MLFRSITYTGYNNYSAGEKISIYGLSTTAFNLSNVTINSATSSQFTVVNGATGTAVSGSTSGRSYKLATENDTRLGFEFYRMPVTLASSDITTALNSSSYAVVFKATVPQDVAGTISEVGLYPSNRISVINYDSKFLADFYDALDWIDGSGYNAASSPTGSKIGSSVLNFVATLVVGIDVDCCICSDLPGEVLTPDNSTLTRRSTVVRTNQSTALPWNT